MNLQRDDPRPILLFSILIVAGLLPLIGGDTVPNAQAAEPSFTIGTVVETTVSHNTADISWVSGTTWIASVGSGTDVRVFRTTDNGGSWSERTVVDHDFTVTTSQITALTSSIWFVAVGSSSEATVYQTKDAGGSWSVAVDSPSGTTAVSIDARSTTGEDIVAFLVQDDGTDIHRGYFSTDGGDLGTWTGDPGVVVDDDTGGSTGRNNIWIDQAGDMHVVVESSVWASYTFSANSGSSWADKIDFSPSGSSESPCITGRGAGEWHSVYRQSSSNPSAEPRYVAHDFTVQDPTGNPRYTSELITATNTSATTPLDKSCHAPENRDRELGFFWRDSEAGVFLNFTRTVNDGDTWDTTVVRTGDGDGIFSVAADGSTDGRYMAVYGVFPSSGPDRLDFAFTDADSGQPIPCPGGTDSCSSTAFNAPIVSLETNWGGGRLVAREEGEFSGSENRNVYLFSPDLSLLNSHDPCSGTGGGNIGPDDRSLSFNTDGTIHAVCGVGFNTRHLFYPSTLASDDIQGRDCITTPTPPCSVVTSGSFFGQTAALTPNHVAIASYGERFNYRDVFEGTDRYSAPTLGSPEGVSIDPVRERAAYVTPSQLRFISPNGGILFDSNTQGGNAVQIYDSTIWVSDDAETRRLVITSGAASVEVENTSLPVPVGYAGTKLSRDGDFLVWWSGVDVRVLHSGNLSTAFHTTIPDANDEISAATLDIGNNRLFVATTGPDLFRYDVGNNTTAFGEGEGLEENPVPGDKDGDGVSDTGNDGTDFGGSENPTANDKSTTDPPESDLAGQVPAGEGFMGSDFRQPAEDAGISTKAYAFFVGLLLIIAIGGGLYLLTKSGLVAGVGFLLGVGFAFAFKLVPLWFLVIVFAGIVVIGIVAFQRRT